MTSKSALRVALALLLACVPYSTAVPCSDLSINTLPSGSIVVLQDSTFEIKTKLSDDEAFTVCVDGAVIAMHGTLHTGNAGRTFVNTSATPGLSVININVTRGTCDTVSKQIRVLVTAPSTGLVDHSIAMGCSTQTTTAKVDTGALSPFTSIVIQTGGRATCPVGMALSSGFCFSLPDPVPLMASAGPQHTIVAMSDGSIFNFGLRTYAGLGPRNGDTSIDTTAGNIWQPGRVTGDLPTLTTGKTIVDVQSGAGQAFVLLNDGGLINWGYNNFGTIGRSGVSANAMPGLITTLPAPVSSFSLSPSHHVCVILTTNALHCWGYNLYTQCGRTSTNPNLDDDPTTASATPDGLAPSQVVTGNYHSHILLSDGTVASSGHNAEGELGRSATTPTTFERIPTLSGITKLGAYFWGCYAIKNDNTVWGWGKNWVSTLGLGHSNIVTTPTQITSLDGLSITAISAGYYGAVAQGINGNFYTAGLEANQNAQAATSGTFVSATNLAGATTCNYNQQHGACYWPDGTVKTYGMNNWGQCGVDTAAAMVTVPATVVFFP